MPGSSSRSPKLDVFPIMASAAEKLEVPPVYRHLLYARHHTEHRSMKTDSEWSKYQREQDVSAAQGSRPALECCRTDGAASLEEAWTRRRL
jgi:hypothetical protein